MCLAPHVDLLLCSCSLDTCRDDVTDRKGLTRVPRLKTNWFKEVSDNTRLRLAQTKDCIAMRRRKGSVDAKKALPIHRSTGMGTLLPGLHVLP